VAALAAIGPQPEPDLASREDYGSTLRDAAALVTLAAEGGADHATVQAAVQRVETARAFLRPTSTQEDAWLLLAASAMAKDAGNVSLDVNGEATKQSLYRTIRAGDFKLARKMTVEHITANLARVIDVYAEALEKQQEH